MLTLPETLCALS